MNRRVNRISHLLCISVLLLSSVIAAEARATPIEFSAELLEDDGSIYYATFSIDSSDIDIQATWIEEVSDFIAVVDGITYSWGPVLPDPPPFNAAAAYDAGNGALIAIETPSITAVGHPSTINVRLLLDGTWTANTCIPLPSCNPDYLFGTYTLDPVIVPEPGTAMLVLGGLLFVGRFRTNDGERTGKSNIRTVRR
jgi:hypothetical protein